MYYKKSRTIYYVRLKRQPMPKDRPKDYPMPLSKAIEGFLLTCQARRLSVHTIDDYQRTLKRFLTHAGDMRIAQIGTTQITAFLAAQTVGEKTLLNMHIGLAALWTYAVKEDFAPKHIVRMVERPKPIKLIVQPFTEIEIRAMLSAINNEPSRNRSIILTLLDTGVRNTELISLKRTDIDLVNRHIKVLGKGNKERLIPFSPRTASSIFSHLATSDGDPFPLTRTSLSQYIRRLGKRAGVLGAHPHKFRHTFAVNYLRNGGNAYELQQLLGHSTMEMVRTYVNLAQVDLDTAHARASPVEKWKL